VGKSSFAVALARRVGGEVIGADAFQVYRGIPVLTSQPGESERGGVPHHLIGFLDPAERFDAGRFLREATRLIGEIRARGNVPIVAGGTGLYLKALANGLAALPEPDAELRAAVSSMPLGEAVRLLAEKDPAAHGALDLKNPARVRRALELVLQTGRPLAEARSGAEGGIDCAGVCLVRERGELRARIDGNVSAMLAGGAVEEVAEVAKGPCGGARRAIGFREIEALLSGASSMENCRDAIQSATRQYAKRQLTWCRTQLNFPQVDLSEHPSPDSALGAVLGLPGFGLA